MSVVRYIEGACSSERASVRVRTREVRVRRAFVSRAMMTGSPEAAGSMRAAGGGGVQEPGGCAAPRTAASPRARAP